MRDLQRHRKLQNLPRAVYQARSAMCCRDRRKPDKPVWQCLWLTRSAARDFNSSMLVVLSLYLALPTSLAVSQQPADRGQGARGMCGARLSTTEKRCDLLKNLYKSIRGGGDRLQSLRRRAAAPVVLACPPLPPRRPPMPHLSPTCSCRTSSRQPRLTRRKRAKRRRPNEVTNAARAKVVMETSGNANGLSSMRFNSCIRA